MRYTVRFTNRQGRTGAMAINAHTPEEALTCVKNYYDIIYGSGVQYTVEDSPENADPFYGLSEANDRKEW